MDTRKLYDLAIEGLKAIKIRQEEAFFRDMTMGEDVRRLRRESMAETEAEIAELVRRRRAL